MGFCETRLDAVSMCETVNCRADTFFVHDKVGMEACFRENMMEEMVQQSDRCQLMRAELVPHHCSFQVQFFVSESKCAV